MTIRIPTQGTEQLENLRMILEIMLGEFERPTTEKQIPEKV